MRRARVALSARSRPQSCVSNLVARLQYGYSTYPAVQAPENSEPAAPWASTAIVTNSGFTGRVPPLHRPSSLLNISGYSGIASTDRGGAGGAGGPGAGASTRRFSDLKSKFAAFVSHSRTSEGDLSPVGAKRPFVSVIPDIITEAEERILMQNLEPVLLRKSYQWGSWDAVLEDYKATEILDYKWSPECLQIVNRIRMSYGLQNEEGAAPWLPVSAIDLAPTGFIRPHVDSVTFSGEIVAGLSLLSSAKMQLSRASNNDLADLLLPRRSLYVLRGPARFEWAHAILPNDGQPVDWHGQKYARGRRVSLMFRDELVGPSPKPQAGVIMGNKIS